MSAIDASALVAKEFDCYYQADELIWEDWAFRKLAKNSAERFAFYASGDSLNKVVDILRGLQLDRNGDFIKKLERDTNIDWSDEINWIRFQHQIEMILDFLRNPASH
ncbi:hypothetical protein J2X20_001192 [Pelomonas saccharophila]|uniref:CdiI immunity protein domain-containing protein n=1 Tax=Roseateles saccharophilus TaxID=304 RepID=A0ABU1YI80_ROSSA|nr:hypothetical protein [Roseateles saccharophilus]MDR7268563.1 hypothetical protein [Roseateles saccharophilus]